MKDFGSTELEMLWLSVVLGLVQLFAATMLSVNARGMPWGIGPRDTAAPPLGLRGARVERAYRNFVETFPFFAAAVLIAELLDKHTALSAFGAELYFWSRLAYAPIYALGIAYVRTAAWIISLVGIVLVLSAVYPGG